MTERVALPEGWRLTSEGESIHRLTDPTGETVAVVVRNYDDWTARLTRQGEHRWSWSAPLMRDVVPQVLRHLGAVDECAELEATLRAVYWAGLEHLMLNRRPSGSLLMALAQQSHLDFTPEREAHLARYGDLAVTDGAEVASNSPVRLEPAAEVASGPAGSATDPNFKPLRWAKERAIDAGDDEMASALRDVEKTLLAFAHSAEARS